MKLQVGDRIRETYKGYVSHCEHHGEPKGAAVDVKIMGMSGKIGMPTPRALWRAKKGTVIEIRERWFFQEGNDVLVRWSDGQEEWRLEDKEHLEVI